MITKSLLKPWGKEIAAVSSKNARILIVDDEREFADSLAEHMSNLGYSARIAYDGKTALEQFRSGDYHVVLTDLQMPGMDGMDLLDRIKKLDGGSVVVVLTGFGTVEAAVKAIKAGAYDFITKPVKLEQLEIVVARALEKRRLIKQIGFFRGLTLAILVSIPVWLVLGIILAWKLL
jgi:DNA-binding NtrC family response regulator